MEMLKIPLAVALGALLWTLTEYVFHRFWFHGDALERGSPESTTGT